MRANLLLVVLLALPAAAQNSLKQMLDAADKQNVDLRIAGQALTRAEAEYAVAWSALVPSLLVSGAVTHNQFESVIGPPVLPTRLVITPFDQLDGVLRVDLPLIDTGRWYRTITSSMARQGAADRQEFTRDQIRRGVVSNYYVYAASVAVRESARRSLGVSQAQLQLQEIREKAGAITELDLLRARAEVQRTLQVVADTENLVATSRRGLTSLSSVDPGEVANLPPDDLTAEPAFQELEKNIAVLPAVRAAETDAAIADRLATAQKLSLVPVVGAQFTERVTNATGFSNQWSTYTFGLNLTWRIDVPTFQGMAVQKAQTATARLAVEKVCLQARDQIHSDWQRHHAALTKVQAAQAQVEAARKAAQVARDRYTAGAGTQLDVIQSERDLFSSEVNQIQARTELASARAGLRISAGLPLGID